MNEIYVLAALGVWWGIAVVILALMIGEIGDVFSASEVLSVSVFWPLFTIFGLVIVLWRIPFKSAKTIRVSLKNRGLMNEFDEFMAARKKREADEIAADPEKFAEERELRDSMGSSGGKQSKAAQRRKNEE